MALARAISGTAVIAVALALSLSVAGCSRLISAGVIPAVIQPKIVPSATETGSEVITHEFAFEGGMVRLEVPVDKAVYAGAVSAQKSAIFVGGEEPANWTADYYRAFVDEPHQSVFYDSILDALRQLRESDALDSSRYVELITSMVQGLEYRTDTTNLAPKFPIETFGDGYGDCDDKALLAAALLSRDGYDVAILLFAPEKHVALGIRADGLDYKGTGYAYVETTEPSLVGVPVETLVGAGELTSQPEVIRIGDGSDSYTAGAQITYIESRLDDAEAAEKSLRAKIEKDKAALDKEQATLEQARRELESITDPAAYNAAVKQYNRQVAAYNDDADDLRRLIDRHNAIVETLQYVADNLTARPQVFSALRSLRL